MATLTIEDFDHELSGDLDDAMTSNTEEKLLSAEDGLQKSCPANNSTSIQGSGDTSGHRGVHAGKDSEGLVDWYCRKCARKMLSMEAPVDELCDVCREALCEELEKEALEEAKNDAIATSTKSPDAKVETPLSGDIILVLEARKEYWFLLVKEKM